MRRLVIALVTAGLAAWIAGPALSSGPVVPRAVNFEQAIERADGQTTGAGGWRSGVIETSKRFDLAGLSWRSGGEADARIRLRDASSGEWSPWTRMADDHAGGHGAEPVWAGGSDALQLRLRRHPRGLRAQLVNSTGTATAPRRALTALRGAAHDAYVALTGAPAHAQGEDAYGRPTIIPREAWGADQCEPRTDPTYGEVRAGVVHHTVDANGYDRADSAAIVLAICRYHRNSRGWHDIGYNFLVDRFGQVFEGRAGGVDQPVIGAHAEGYNTETSGIANLGSFGGVAPSDAAVEATSKLLAWKLSLHGVPLLGETRVRSGGGATNRHPRGAPVTVQRVGGHRDLDRTSCPGNRLARQLPRIRRRAAQLAAAIPPRPAPAASVTLESSGEQVEYPDPTDVGGRVTTPDGRPLGGVPVAVQIATTDGFRTQRRTTSAADGSWSARPRNGYTRTLRAVAALPGGETVPSALLRVGVASRLTLRVRKRVAAGRRFTVRGSVRPTSSDLSLAIARKGSDGSYHTVARVPLKVRSRRFRARIGIRRPALNRLRVVSSGTARNAPARSRDDFLRTTRRR